MTEREEAVAARGNLAFMVSFVVLVVLLFVGILVGGSISLYLGGILLIAAFGQFALVLVLLMIANVMSNKP